MLDEPKDYDEFYFEIRVPITVTASSYERALELIHDDPLEYVHECWLDHEIEEKQQNMWVRKGK